MLALLTRRMKMADAPPPSPTGTDLPWVGLEAQASCSWPPPRPVGTSRHPFLQFRMNDRHNVGTLPRGRFQNPVPLSNACKTQWVVRFLRGIPSKRGECPSRRAFPQTIGPCISSHPSPQLRGRSVRLGQGPWWPCGSQQRASVREPRLVLLNNN